ncbi:hypothetical protein KIN20_037309 [Parelaphostrongylus tenuis]|uniref:Uncharacterized protein n=1 Tax=Parelaphostrongylus tenuis TaxID=148309 RepID=A0AAD5REF1_PARTN|nr:hypothetical protein KIN20_037309 [Parelaphostrongylus tenuis]
MAALPLPASNMTGVKVLERHKSYPRIIGIIKNDDFHERFVRLLQIEHRMWEEHCKRLEEMVNNVKYTSILALPNDFFL